MYYVLKSLVKKTPEEILNEYPLLKKFNIKEQYYPLEEGLFIDLESLGELNLLAKILEKELVINTSRLIIIYDEDFTILNRSKNNEKQNRHKKKLCL